MESVEIIKEKCKNYDYIINYNYKRNDIVTETIINTYQECIFSNSNKSELIYDLAKKYFNNANIIIKKDNYNRDRMLFILNNLE